MSSKQASSQGPSQPSEAICISCYDLVNTRFEHTNDPSLAPDFARLVDVANTLLDGQEASRLPTLPDADFNTATITSPETKKAAKHIHSSGKTYSYVGSVGREWINTTAAATPYEIETMICFPLDSEGKQATDVPQMRVLGASQNRPTAVEAFKSQSKRDTVWSPALTKASAGGGGRTSSGNKSWFMAIRRQTMGDEDASHLVVINDMPEAKYRKLWSQVQSPPAEVWRGDAEVRRYDADAFEPIDDYFKKAVSVAIDNSIASRTRS